MVKECHRHSHSGKQGPKVEITDQGRLSKVAIGEFVTDSSVGREWGDANHLFDLRMH